MQIHGDDWFFIRCRSPTLTEAQQMYSAYGLELLAVAFACKHLHIFMLSGLHFSIHTECIFLHGLQNIDISSINSHRSLHWVEQILPHNVSVGHNSSKFNSVAYNLSRTDTGTPLFPDYNKFIQPCDSPTPLSLFYRWQMNFV